MKRVAMISEHASPLALLGGVDAGGQNVYVAELAQGLAARGATVDIFTRREDPRTPTIVDWSAGVRVIDVEAGPPTVVPKEELLPYMPAFAQWMHDFMQRNGRRYDVLHAHFWTSAVAASLLRIPIQIPLVITFHALGRVRLLHQKDADRFPPTRGCIEERLIAGADAVIAECPQDATDLIALYHARPNRLRVVPCGVDCQRFRPLDREAARMAIGYDSADPLLLQLGRMVPRKGVDDVVRALARLRNEHGIPVRLMIVGGESDEPDEVATPYLRQLRTVAAAAGVGEAITLVGRRGGDRLREYYSAADAFVTTPWYEPFGITPLEAMACGTPVIGSAVGGIKYTVIDGETGFLVPPRDPQAIAERAKALLCCPDMRAWMSHHAVQRVRRSFQWCHVAAAVDRLYNDVADRHGAGRLTAA